MFHGIKCMQLQNAGSNRPDMAKKTKFTLENCDFSSTLTKLLSWNLGNWVCNKIRNTA